ncbi:MAG: hypothetical protein K2O91_24120 [Lachnospiraceae bacterium]|nr:hypothetical protein [Lachnospiraceae bacterium]
MKYGLKSDYDFSELNVITPDMVMRDICDELNEITKGFVIGNVCEYEGQIESYDMMSTMRSLSESLAAATRTDIQNQLGAIGEANFKYELYLSASKVENYKYRILFVGYSVDGYPVEVVVEQGIADELNKAEGLGYIYTIESKEEFEDLLVKIFNSKIIQKVIQNLITVSNRKLRMKIDEVKG